ncbi:hypothetical protein A3A64_02085 [Candidatus Gottesmanbacteria bacterium RIFCSPLOWO2_01_FULL_48_11]|uniref:Uncharacterized protein n=2 Tax=Candidatus Gottesmaniibacteriota TaxID=1752720 RepID=A0A0G1WYM6_9BACT|nr:MAG: hypothetical protein UY27_C0018G0005 [Candidatus Gottesmanbacteria bacterium GW2011_GWA1_48_13]OGG27168.1 MAG: hypothetical protein A3A64_02085 [Candidatus Gottesmanbacteria bacterium RIFCSPLOWO2_01_FULL_48_11]
MTTTKQQILDIAMNLNRIGNWAADGFEARQKRIIQFLEQTKDYLQATEQVTYSVQFKPTMDAFAPEFQVLYNEGIQKPTNTLHWAEKMMTWGNILTHRASLL